MVTVFFPQGIPQVGAGLIEVGLFAGTQAPRCPLTIRPLQGPVSISLNDPWAALNGAAFFPRPPLTGRPFSMGDPALCDPALG